MDPTAPMMKAPKVLLAELRSLQHDHSGFKVERGQPYKVIVRSRQVKVGSGWVRVGSRWVIKL